MILIYQGDVTQDTAMSILKMAERKLVSTGEASCTRRKVFNVAVEVLQNIARHGDNNQPSFFLIDRNHGLYSIMSVNEVRNVNLPVLIKALEHINSLDKEGLNDLYRKVIHRSFVSTEGGAGLGLVDIARKSGEKLQWAFIPKSEEISRFVLQVNMPASI